MSKRKEAFLSQIGHPVLGGCMKRLQKNGLEECLKFIEENDHLDSAAFSAKLNMWHVDSKVKPKNLTDMWGMLCNANSIVYPFRK